MDTPNLESQKKAVKAIYSNNVEEFLDALLDGARMDLSEDGLMAEPGIVKNDIIGPGIYNLVQVAIGCAVSSTNENCTSILLCMKRNGADLKSEIKATFKPESIENRVRSGSFMRLLLDHWPDDFGDWKTSISLQKMTRNDEFQKILTLISKGFEVDMRDSKGCTALMYVRAADTAKALLEAGADLYAIDNKGKTPIWHAAQNIIRKTKTTASGKLYVPHQETMGFIYLSGERRLLDDPLALEIGAKIGKLFDEGLQTMVSKTVIPDSFISIQPQIKELQALSVERALGKFIKKKGTKLTVEKTPKRYTM